jgi:hypothetical protein
VNRFRHLAALTRHALVVGVLLAVASAAAGGWRALDLPDRLEAAREALVGRVASVEVEVRDGEPWTVVVLEVERWFRHDGRATRDGPNEARLALWGGRAPGAPPLLVAGAPSFAVGDRVVLLLRALDDGSAVPIVGVDQGWWRWVDGVWQGAAGERLGIGAGGRPSLAGADVPDGVLFDALDAAFRALEEEAP